MPPETLCRLITRRLPKYDAEPNLDDELVALPIGGYNVKLDHDFPADPPQSGEPQPNASASNDPHDERRRSAPDTGRRNAGPALHQLGMYAGGWHTVRHEPVGDRGSWIHQHVLLDAECNIRLEEENSRRDSLSAGRPVQKLLCRSPDRRQQADERPHSSATRSPVASTKQALTSRKERPDRPERLPGEHNGTRNLRFSPDRDLPDRLGVQSMPRSAADPTDFSRCYRENSMNKKDKLVSLVQTYALAMVVRPENAATGRSPGGPSMQSRMHSMQTELHPDDVSGAAIHLGAATLERRPTRRKINI